MCSGDDRAVGLGVSSPKNTGWRGSFGLQYRDVDFDAVGEEAFVPASVTRHIGIFGYEESYKNPYRQVDVARAQKLLIEAGYPGGIDPNTKKPLRLTFDTGNTSPAALLQYEFFVRALIVATVSGALCGLIGVYVVLRRLVFLTAAVSQAAGLGVVPRIVSEGAAI